MHFYEVLYIYPHRSKVPSAPSRFFNSPISSRHIYSQSVPYPTLIRMTPFLTRSLHAISPLVFFMFVTSFVYLSSLRRALLTRCYLAVLMCELRIPSPPSKHFFFWINCDPRSIELHRVASLFGRSGWLVNELVIYGTVDAECIGLDSSFRGIGLQPFSDLWATSNY